MARILVIALLVASGCVTITSPQHDALAGAPAYEAVADLADPAGAVAPQAFVGVELEEAIVGSLDAMEFLGGLRVATVAAGSPAEAAGIKAGDRIVKAARGADGAIELARVDQWSALLAAAQAGDELVLTVERDGGLVDVPVRAASRGSGARLPARRFVERRKARCVVETEIVVVEGGTRSAARVVELAPTSPLRAAGVAAGDRILALDGEALAGAADFARRVSLLPYGAAIELELQDGHDGKPGRRAVTCDLFEPERHWTEIQLWPLVDWAEPADESTTDVAIVDLWLIWLFKYERKGETSRCSILRFIAWETGIGALTEEPAR